MKIVGQEIRKPWVPGVSRWRAGRTAPAMLLAAAVSLGTTVGLPPQGPTVNPERREAAGVLVIHRPGEERWLDSTTLSALVESSGVADAAAAEILGMEPEFRQQDVHFKNGYKEEQDLLMVFLRVSLEEKGQPLDLPKKYLAAVVGRLRAAIFDLKKERVSQLERQIQMTQEEIRTTGNDLGRIHDEMSELDQATGMKLATSVEVRSEPGRLRNEVANLVRTLGSYRIQLERETVEDEGKRGGRQAEEWRRAIELREEKLEEFRELSKEGRVSPFELTEFEARLAEARANLASFRGPAAQQIMPGGLQRDRAGLAEALAQSTKDLTDLEGRLEKLGHLDLRRVASDLEAREMEERRLLDSLNHLKARLEKLEQQLPQTRALTISLVGD
jgi:hypothetical protein